MDTIHSFVSISFHTFDLINSLKCSHNLKCTKIIFFWTSVKQGAWQADKPQAYSKLIIKVIDPLLYFFVFHNKEMEHKPKKSEEKQNNLSNTVYTFILVDIPNYRIVDLTVPGTGTLGQDRAE